MLRTVTGADGSKFELRVRGLIEDREGNVFVTFSGAVEYIL